MRNLPPARGALRTTLLVALVRIDLLRRWRGGSRPTVESYLKAIPELGTADSVSADLVAAEFEARRQAGSPCDPTEVARRFPRQAAELQGLLQTQDAPSTGAALAGGKEQLPARLSEQFGRYRILGVLGKGGMGTVYLAEDTQLDRKVALKVPRFCADDPDAGVRFLREGRAAAALEHPNICPVFDSGEIDGVRYLAMACIEGQTLAETARATRYGVRAAAALVRKLALVLAEAHDRGLVHRDLKPSNVMINQRDEPVIMDFGLARRLGTDEARLTREGSLLGTPSYMAPEQIDGDLDALGPACDIYSLGVILYELLAGQVPFRGTLTSVLRQIATEPPRPVTALRPDAGPVLEEICRRAMAKRPGDRFASMRRFATALQDYLKEPARPCRVAPEPPEEDAPTVPRASAAAHTPDADDREDEPTDVPADESTLGKRKKRRRAESTRRRWLLLGSVLALVLMVGALGWALGSGLFSGTDQKPTDPPDSKPGELETFAAWETFSPAGQGFSVRLPGQPRTVTRKQQTMRGEVEQTEHTLSATPFHYSITYADFPGKLIQKDEVDEALDLARDGAVKAVKGAKLREYTRVELDGHPGRELVIEITDGEKSATLRGRFYLVKQRLYQVLVAGNTADMKRPEVAYFLRSFRLTRR
jgi:serine/threonine protein kinase